MIAENISKSEFILQTVERDVRNIYKAQLIIATQNIYLEGRDLKAKRRKGKTLADDPKNNSIIRALQNPDFILSQQGESFVLTANIVKKLRFRDMKKFGNWRIYNAQVWGILYNNALRDIRLNYGNALRDKVGEALTNAFEQSVSVRKSSRK
ncbi:hypothetical protein MASR1M31_04660 [Porphyromonadaceae bacterium]